MKKRRTSLRRRHRILGLLAVLLILAGLLAVRLREPKATVDGAPSVSSLPSLPAGGKILSRSKPIVFDLTQVEAISRQNYGSFTPKALNEVQEVTVQYQSRELDGTPITIYARIYQPVGKSHVPILGFAPGTTGIGDQCAASLENVAKANWANYESHMMTYAGQGYASVITDYEGMRDPARIHHYMVGALEGRAVLDSIRALINLDHATNELDTSSVFVGGYSQGGHAAFWADQIAPTYAPELKLKGVVGFGPVMDVAETLADVTHGANINWFGPYVLVSYANYYGDNYDPSSILLPKWTANLTTDVESHCIDTDLSFWGSKPDAVYTPAFLQALATGLAGSPYSLLADRTRANEAGSATTATAKLINEGSRDNVVLPQQQTAAMPRICAASRGPATLTVWPGASHYTTMEVSLASTLKWMADVRAGKAVANQCSATPSPTPSITPTPTPTPGEPTAQPLL